MQEFGRSRSAVGTLAAGKCFHWLRTFFEFSQTFTSISVTQEKQKEKMFSVSFGKHHNKTKRKESHMFISSIKMTFFLSTPQLVDAHAIITSTGCASSVILTIKLQKCIIQHRRSYRNCFIKLKMVKTSHSNVHWLFFASICVVTFCYQMPVVFWNQEAIVRIGVTSKHDEML